MKVKRLEISGFKSFADRTFLDFPQEMCAVVGPNGCGKSNVVDAIRWVLGEQSAKTLRGSSMEDVLFNGSESRSASGLSEVSLIFENNGDAVSPQFADLSEIMVTRRLYRSGDSEYLINKMPCRLKDIQQLFMDTGLGNRAYAIIEQGKVAAFIEARPEERRLWVEEAAGITRYKNQKKLSLRKMKQAGDNLERLDDIIHEVGVQMNRLQRQAKKAQRHQELSGRIRELDLNIVSHEYDRLERELEDVQAEIQAVGAQLLLANQRVTGLETDQETMKVQLVTAEQEIRQAAEKRMAAQEAIMKAESEVSLLGREAENQRRLADRYRREREELREKLAGMQRDLAAARRLVEQSRERLEQSRDSVNQASEDVLRSQSALAEGEQKRDQAKEELADHLFRVSRLNSRLGDLERTRSDLNRRREQMSQRQEALETELAELSREHGLCAENASLLEEELASARARGADLTARRDQCQAGREDLARAEQEAIRRRAALAASLEGLSLSLASHDWARSGVREVLEASAQGNLPVEVLGLTADHLEVKPGAEPVAEAALGADLQALLTPDGRAARALSQWVEEAGLGRLRILALDELASRLEASPRGSSPLAGVVRPEPGFEPLAALLAGAGWCADLGAAWIAARSMDPGQVVVTPAGQRLDRPGAALVGGGDRDQGASVLARRNELNERQAELDAAEGALARAEDDRRRAEAELTSLEEELRAAAAVCKDVEQRLVNRQQELYRLGEAANLKQRQLEGLEFDAGEIWTELDRCNTETDQVRAELDQGRDAERELEEKLARAQEGLDASRQALERARELENEIRLAEASLASEAEHAGREAGRLIREVESSEQRFEELGREIEAAEGSVEDLGSRRQEQQTRLGELYQQLDDLEQSHRQARELLGQAQMRASDLESSLKQARSEQRRAESASQDLRLRQQELKLQVENLCEQALERCRVDITGEYRAFLPQGAFDPENARQRLAKMRQRLHNMGPVNMEAISEHAALSERHEFLTSQRQDLESSLEDLRQAIRKINRTSRGRFTETLEEVNRRLEEVFPVLFGGGQARLTLDEGVDPLDAGLHLMVEPPGKKLRHISSMSGGEKAMAAAAVLFALFLIRPAPFCILDEVDAPLDEANVGRFHELLRQLSERSQIILITHSRRTMEIMDKLYGVTMEEKGVSKILTVNLEVGRSIAA